MKKTVFILLIILLMVGCNTKGLLPLEITYSIGSLEAYNKDVAVSKVIRNKSDFQLIELGIEDVFYYNLYDYVITIGETSATTDTLNALEGASIELESTQLLEILAAIKDEKSVLITGTGKVIPALPELKAQADTVPLPETFIKSILRELGV